MNMPNITARNSPHSLQHALSLLLLAPMNHTHRATKGIIPYLQGVFYNADEIARKDIRVGDTVELLKFGSKATVLAINTDGSYQLQAGIMKVNAKPDEVYLLENETQAKAKKLMEGKVRELKAAAQPELDIRGMAVDEALPVLDNLLDAAYMGNLPNARIIHGKGTGVLRAAVQDELRRCKYVKSFRLGVYGEGESGVTIVEFK